MIDNGETNMRKKIIRSKWGLFGPARRGSIFPSIFIMALAIVAAGCKSNSSAPGVEAKHYHLTGKIISVDKQGGTAMVDHQAIPGFMDAMTMAYPVPDAAALAALGPGDEITADVVVPTDDPPHLENIVVTKKGNGKTQLLDPTHEPQAGEAVPDFVLVDQAGRQLHLNSFKGKVLLITFIYTRCPFPDFCPLVSKNFAKIYALTSGNPQLKSRLRLLSVSFDPKHDTPRALRDYADTFKADAGGNPFDRWEFGTIPEKELKDAAEFFGLYIQGDLSSEGVITHSLSTSVISPDGKIYKWYSDNTWKPEDLVQDATQILSQTVNGKSGGRVSGD
jgi:protein SCO1/2